MGMDAVIIVFGREMTSADTAKLRDSFPLDEDDFPIIEPAKEGMLFGGQYVPGKHLWVGSDQDDWITIELPAVVVIPACRFFSEQYERKSWPMLKTYFEQIKAAIPDARIACEPDYSGCPGYEVTPAKIAQLDEVHASLSAPLS